MGKRQKELYRQMLEKWITKGLPMAAAVSAANAEYKAYKYGHTK